MYSPTPATKLQHLFGKVRSLPSTHQERAVVALAEIVEDCDLAQHEEMPSEKTA